MLVSIRTILNTVEKLAGVTSQLQQLCDDAMTRSLIGTF